MFHKILAPASFETLNSGSCECLGIGSQERYFSYKIFHKGLQDIFCHLAVATLCSGDPPARRLAFLPVHKSDLHTVLCTLWQCGVHKMIEEHPVSRQSCANAKVFTQESAVSKVRLPNSQKRVVAHHCWLGNLTTEVSTGRRFWLFSGTGLQPVTYIGECFLLFFKSSMIHSHSTL